MESNIFHVFFSPDWYRQNVGYINRYILLPDRKFKQIDLAANVQIAVWSAGETRLWNTFVFTEAKSSSIIWSSEIVCAGIFRIF